MAAAPRRAAMQRAARPQAARQPAVLQQVVRQREGALPGVPRQVAHPQVVLTLVARLKVAPAAL